MSRASSWIWLLPGLLGGCAVDLLVGPSSGSDETTASSSTGDTTAAPPLTDGSTGTTAQPGTTDGTTVALDDGTSTGSTTEGSSTGPATEGTTAAEIPCPGLGFRDCNDLPYCLWYGTPKAGECALSPCENLRNECFALPFLDCQEAFPCAWEGEPRLGDCAPIECVPCELLGLEQCVETPTCVWNELEVFCFPP